MPLGSLLSARCSARSPDEDAEFRLRDFHSGDPDLDVVTDSPRLPARSPPEGCVVVEYPPVVALEGACVGESLNPRDLVGLGEKTIPPY